ncbi:MAG: LysR family transcriptional regulator [Desulfobacterales bacterium]
MMNFNQLRIFYHAAKTLNFTRAAAELFISQPAVTAQIKAFEEFCGLKLFKKIGRSVFLTGEGQALFEYAQNVFEMEKEIENAIDDIRKLNRGILRIGTTKAYARYFMPVMISAFHRSYPNIRIELNEGSSREMGQSLLEFRNEVAIIAKAEDIEGVHFIPFSKEEMTVIVAPNHPLTKKKSIFFKELAQELFIMKDKGSGTRRLVDYLFARNNCSPNILMETSNAEFIKQLVQAGEGVSFLVREAVIQEIAQNKLVAIPLKGPKIYLDVSIAHLKDQQLSPPAKAFLDTLEKLQFGRDMTPMGIGGYMAKILADHKANKG